MSLLRGMGYCSTAPSGSVPETWKTVEANQEPVEASGSCGSQWKLWKSSGSGGRHVGDKEGVGRGAGGAGEVWKVRKRSGRGPEGCGKVWKRRKGMESNGMLQYV